jgi:hypothetical protein
MVASYTKSSLNYLFENNGSVKKELYLVTNGRGFDEIAKN